MNVSGVVDAEVARSAILKVQNGLVSVYSNLLSAEMVKGNVSIFLGSLNEVGDDLADAEMCYGNGNFSGAVYFAESAYDKLTSLESEIAEAVNTLEVERGQQVSLIVSGSVFGIFLVILIGFLGWDLVRENYCRKILKMKPEVNKVAES